MQLLLIFADHYILWVILVSREENTRLMQHLKGQHRDEETTVIKSQGSNGDWVHVEHSLGMVWECVFLLDLLMPFVWLIH